ncbi:MAG TPA: hypothetical protein PK843_01935 [bacterium]|mgnify:FL=1|nr:hypothetical protein [bacterium]
MRRIQIIGFSLMLFSQFCAADTLIKIDRSRTHGKLSLIADTYIEFVINKKDGQQQWIKVDKKEILDIVGSKGKLIYPRDKYDEMALNYGKVKLRTAQDVVKYKQRKSESILAQEQHEQAEKNRFKIAAMIGGVGGLMAWAFFQAD